MVCYCISGLGADKRAFQYLSLDNLVHVEWIEPEKNESISSYSKRLSDQIETSEPFMLLGLSFGGIIACELAQMLNPVRTILISSIVYKSDLLLLFRLTGSLGLHKLFPASFMKPPMFLAKWFFGISEKEHIQLLKQILKETDTKFIKWAISRILDDEPIPAVNHLVRIHGTKDRLLPFTTNIHYPVENGGHFMIVDRSEEVDEILKKIQLNLG